MKRLLLVRHAKSDWSDESLHDFDRPLNDRGRHDAPRMAKFLLRKKVKPTFLLSSPAMRAYTTARLFADEMGLAENDIALLDELYEASSAQILDAIHGLPDAHDTAAIFSHNPSLTSVVSRFSDDYIANVPTCGVGLITFSGDRWTDVSPQTAKLSKLYAPKDVLAAYS